MVAWFRLLSALVKFFIEPMCKRIGTRLVWAINNFMAFVCVAATAIISLASVNEYSQGIQHVIGGNGAIEAAALVVFSLPGFLLAEGVIYESASLLYLVLDWFNADCLPTVMQITYGVPLPVTSRVDC